MREISKEHLENVERHRQGGDSIRDIVYGSLDGIVTTFAIVAGVAGAGLSGAIVVVLGVANLFADGISMGFGSYLGTKSEREFVEAEMREERRAIQQEPEIMRAKLTEAYAELGYPNDLLDHVIQVFTAEEDKWLKTSARVRLSLPDTEELTPAKDGIVTFVSFIVAGSVPLIAFLLPLGDSAFHVAIVLTGLALFGIGAARTLVTAERVVRSGIEMLGVGGLAAGGAYVIGSVLSAVFNVSL